MRALSGVFSGMGQRPQLTRTCSRMSRARACHSLREVMVGKVRGVLRSLGGALVDRRSSIANSQGAESSARSVRRRRQDEGMGALCGKTSNFKLQTSGKLQASNFNAVASKHPRKSPIVNQKLSLVLTFRRLP